MDDKTNPTYDFKIPEDFRKANFKPACISFRDYISRFNGFYKEFKFVDCGFDSNTYHHVSGATVYIDPDPFDPEISIFGVKKAIDDTRASLELLTERRLEEYEDRRQSRVESSSFCDIFFKAFKYLGSLIKLRRYYKPIPTPL